MNSDQMAGKWKQMKGAVKQQWGKLTDDDLDMIDGQHDILIGRLQERYGIAKEEAKKRADEWMKTFDEAADLRRQQPQREGGLGQPKAHTGKR